MSITPVVVVESTIINAVFDLWEDDILCVHAPKKYEKQGKKL